MNRKNEFLSKGIRQKTNGRLLERHTVRNQNTSYVNKHLYYLLCRPETFVDAYAKVSKNQVVVNFSTKLKSKGSELAALEQAQRISNQFKKRVWVGGSKWSIETREALIVQEALNSILEAIYEPEFKAFERLNKFTCTNYGFRLGTNAWEAVYNIKINGRRTTHVIEADIEQAYSHLNHRKLMQILRRRIKDEAFLGVVYSLLKSGVMDNSRFQHSLIGTPFSPRARGGTVSALLLNVYMFDMDKKIYETVVQPLINRKTKPRANPAYAQLTYKLIQKKKLPTTSATEKRTRTRLIKAVQKQLFRIPSQEISSLPKHALFCRYANNWVLLVTGTMTETKNILTHMSSLYKQTLCLELSPSKTKITRLDNGFQWLGFSIKMNNTKPIKITKLLRKKRDSSGRLERVLKRVTSRVITINPDKKRLLSNFINQGFCKKAGVHMPSAKAAWTVLSNFQIVNSYAQVIRGLYTYYANCDNKKALNWAQYVLKYSCAKTLARRKKISIRQIFKVYGGNMRVIKTGSKTGVTKTEFPSNSILKLITTKPTICSDFDPFYVKTFPRIK